MHGSSAEPEVVGQHARIAGAMVDEYNNVCMSHNLRDTAMLAVFVMFGQVWTTILRVEVGVADTGREELHSRVFCNSPEVLARMQASIRMMRLWRMCISLSVSGNLAVSLSRMIKRFRQSDFSFKIRTRCIDIRSRNFE